MSELRKVQLVAREGILSALLNGVYLHQGKFPTAAHKRIIQQLYDETVAEMHEIGLELWFDEEE